MTRSPLTKFVLTPVMLSAAVFAVLTLPLVVLGSKPVTIQLQEEPVFHGQLRDVAPPYLGLATILSLGAGVASIAVMGWQQSIRKSVQTEEQLSGLAQNLKEKEELLETFRLSQSRLDAAGLREFLDEGVTQKPAPEPQDISSKAVSGSEPPVMTAQPSQVQPVTSSQATVQGAAAKFASSQAFLGYAQAKATVKPPTTVTSLGSSEVEQLQSQLQQIKAQMESLQAVLQATPHS